MSLRLRAYVWFRRLLWPRRRRELTLQQMLDLRHRHYERERQERFARYRRSWRTVPASTVVRAMFGK